MLAGKESGGMAGLVQSFQEKGFGGIISSWIGKGENLPISADQIQQVMGSDVMQNLAAKFVPKAGCQTCRSLPGTMDKMTPNGTLPKRNSLPRQRLFYLIVPSGGSLQFHLANITE
jgi:uncharacterized protein YidB (DUF937 family)